MKKIYLVVTTVGVLFFFSALLLAQTGGTEDLSRYTRIGEYYDEICDDKGKCKIRLYQYQKYHHNYSTREWETVDEKWYTGTGLSRQTFTTKYYDFSAEVDGRGALTLKHDDRTQNMRLLSFLGYRPGRPVMEDNVLKFDIGNGLASLEYTYLPGSKELKENIVIPAPITTITNDFYLYFDYTGNSRFAIRDFTICDDNGYCEYMPYDFHTVDQIRLFVNRSFLTNPNITYPVIIDPTVALNHSHVIDGYVQYDSQPLIGPGDPPYHTRKFNAELRVGVSNCTGLCSFELIVHRSFLEWNISTIPQNAIITDINLTTVVLGRGSAINRNVTVVHVEQMNSSYNENTTGGYNHITNQPSCQGVGQVQGNCQYLKDLGNHTFYNWTKVLVNGEHTWFNVTNSKDDLMQVLAEGRKWFSYGLYGLQGEAGYTANAWRTRFHSSSATATANRPTLVVTYEQNHIFNCSRDMVITEEYDADGNDIVIIGSDTLILDADWVNHGNIYGTDDGDPKNCDLHCRNGCFANYQAS